MIILRKKRILAVVSMVIMCVVACTACQTQNKQNNSSSLETTQVVALPVTNKVVVIDARTSVFQMKGITYCIK